MLFLPSHRKGSQCVRSVVEGQLKRHVNHVEQQLLPDQLHLEVLVIKMPGNLERKRIGSLDRKQLHDTD